MMGDDWAHIVVRLTSGQYAVLWLSELIQALRAWCGKTFEPGILDIRLASVPDLLSSRAADPVERADMHTEEAQCLAGQMPGGRLLVLDGGDFAGVLVGTPLRDAAYVDLDWLGRPSGEVHVAAVARTEDVISYDLEGDVFIGKRPSTLLVEESVMELASEPTPGERESDERYINAEIEAHDPEEPLQMGEVYTLAFDVDVELRDTAVGGDVLAHIDFEEDEQLVVLTVQLASDDFEIYTDPQKLRVPRAGKSKGKARFDIEPKHEGEGVVNAVFLKDGNFIQLVTLKLYTGTADQAGVPTVETLGRPVGAAFAVQPRDVGLTILKDDAGFRVVMSGAVVAMATLPITLQQLDHMIDQVRQELQDIVHLPVGPDRTPMYQVRLDIPAEVNQVALERLSRAGFRLYQQIFYGPTADLQANLLGDRLREMAQKERLKIQIFSQEFTLPWGILYMADEYDSDNIDPDMFLGLKHIIEHVPLQSNMQVIEGTIDSRPGLIVSLNVNADIDEDMGAPLVADQRHYWEEISQSWGAQVIVRETGDEVTQALADTTTPDQVFYFYCHAVSKSLSEGGGPDSSALVLSGGRRLTLGDLYIDAPLKKILAGAPLVFINACESAELSPLFYDGFVRYFMAKGARGVIGTECETPALFAAEWARRFFDQFLAGESLGQIFLDLRREFYDQHNNILGLLYALYVDGDTQIVPGVTMTPKSPVM
jgi:hypothetical protein